MAVDVDHEERFPGARLSYERVQSLSRPKTYVVYSSTGQARCPKGLYPCPFSQSFVILESPSFLPTFATE